MHGDLRSEAEPSGLKTKMQPMAMNGEESAHLPPNRLSEFYRVYAAERGHFSQVSEGS